MENSDGNNSKKLKPSKVLGMSFSGCGFMSAYHFGVVDAFHKEGKKFLGLINNFSGASAGSLIASTLAFGRKPEVFQAAKDDMFRVSREVSARGPLKLLYSLSPHFIRQFVKRVFYFVKWDDYPLAENILGILEKFIPGDQHKFYTGVASENKLHVSVTITPSYKNKIISSFSKKEELTKALIASCHVPTSQFMDAPPPMIDGEVCVDGCWSDKLPVLPNVPTITVSPFSGPVNIGPTKEYHCIYSYLKNASRAITAVYTQEKDLERIFKEGREDGLKFLHDNHFNDDHESMNHIENINYADDE